MIPLKTALTWMMIMTHLIFKYLPTQPELGSLLLIVAEGIMIAMILEEVVEVEEGIDVMMEDLSVGHLQRLSHQDQATEKNLGPAPILVACHDVFNCFN